jgi:4-amino-4-deoxy-L-arabinose transferase-like glycosyltransferase
LFVAALSLIAPGATSQDAQEVEILQRHFAAGYQLRNPPLYTWLLWGAQQLVGSGPQSYLIVRYGLIGAAGVLYYFAVLRVVAAERVAAAFSLSLLLFFWFGWEAHTEVSHSLAIIVMLLAVWLAALRYVDCPTTPPALGLGIVIGVGFLAKWSFVFVVLGLGTALFLDSNARPVFGRLRSSVIPLAAALMVLPFIVWLATLDSGTLSSNVDVAKPGSALSKTLRILGQFIGTLCVVFLPWLLVASGLAVRFRRQSKRDQTIEAHIRLAFITAGIAGGALVLILAGSALADVNLFGITDFAPHYLHPFCLLASLGIAGFIAARVDDRSFAWNLALISLLSALVIFLAKLASFYIVLPGVPTGHLIPYARLAEALNARNLGQAQFVTLSARDAGNLATFLPTARALSPSRRKEPPPADLMRERPCILFWGGDYYVPPKQPKPPAADRLLSPLGLRPENHLVVDIQINWDQPLIGETRRSVWHMVSDASAEEACRRFVASGGVRWPFIKMSRKKRAP